MSPTNLFKLVFTHRLYPAFFVSVLSFSFSAEAALCVDQNLLSETVKSQEPQIVGSENEVIVESDVVELIKDKQTSFSGNVILYQQQQTVRADEATFDEINSRFTATGNVKLSADVAQVTGDSIFIDEINKNFQLLNAEYQFGFSAGRGAAEQFNVQQNKTLSLKKASFTTCPGDYPAWLFSSKEININEDDGWGEAWGTVFKVADTPIVYIPYITFPVSEARKTGLLFPNFGSSNRYGTYYAQPIYFNLAENYDLTFTPRYMSARGMQWAGNFRHLTKHSNNIVQLEYINSDEKEPDLGNRYLAYWKHDSNWSDSWNVQVQWTDLSDDNYISDYTSNYHHQADTNLNNFVTLNYHSNRFNFRALSQSMEELGPHQASYTVPLELQSDWLVTQYGEHLNFNIHSRYTRFENDQREIDEVDRVHLMPEVEFDYYTPAFQFESSLSYLSTHYSQHNKESDDDKDISRNVAKFRLLTGLTFEKYGRYFGKSARQTLEPKIQYVYVENSEQGDIGLYDSQQLKEDYFGLFRDTRYSGIDRIEPMDQVTIGFSSSIYNEKNKELFRFGLGQIHKFSEYDEESGTLVDNVSSKPSLAVEWFGQLSTNWQLDGGMLYNRDTGKVDTGFASIDYWLSSDNNLQINHRYVRDIANIKINQSGMFSTYKLSDTWSVAASYHYDVERRASVDGLLGFEYRSCCWSVQVSAQRQVILDLNQTDFANQNELKYDNSIGIQFRINGLGGDSTSTVTKLFADSIFSYRRPYLITN